MLKTVASILAQALSLKSTSTTGQLQITGPGAGTTRTMTVPDANFTAARTDAGQTFTGNQTISGSLTMEIARFNNIGTAQTLSVVDQSGGTATVTAMQPGIGFTTYIFPFCKRGGTLVLGVASKATSGAEPLTSILPVAGSIVFTPIAGNTFIVASLQYTPFGA